MSRPSRRALLGGAAAAGAAAFVPRGRQEPAPLPQRSLGRTGRNLPVLGLGCYPLGNLDDEAAALTVIRRAYETGARYFDTAPSYGDGRSELRLGKALAGVPRAELFIATKTLERDGARALAELEQSLERLGLEYVDSVQVHEVRSAEDVAALEDVVAALASAIGRGKLRHLGVTGHRDPKFVLQAIERYPFTTALVPVNPLDCHHLSFTRQFVPQARARGVAVIAMKVYAGGALPAQRPAIASADLVRFALAQDGVAVAVPGADAPERWDQALAAALAPAPDAEEQAALVAAAGPHRQKASEWYKNEA